MGVPERARARTELSKSLGFEPSPSACIGTWVEEFRRNELLGPQLWPGALPKMPREASGSTAAAGADRSKLGIAFTATATAARPCKELGITRDEHLW